MVATTFSVVLVLSLNLLFFILHVLLLINLLPSYSLIQTLGVFYPLIILWKIALTYIVPVIHSSFDHDTPSP